MNPYLIQAPIKINFSEINNENYKIFEHEFYSLSEAEADPIAHWIKLRKASGEIDDNLKIVVDMLVELNRKIDRLENIIKKDNIIKFVLLDFTGDIESIGFEYFKLSQNLSQDKKYYGRINLNIYPPREIPMFFKVNDNLCKIEKMHERDERDWASYLRAKERVIIREGRK
jgi:hypothetical protein